MVCIVHVGMYIFASIYWDHHIIQAKYLHNTYQYIPGYMPILVCWAKTCVLNQCSIGMYLACIVVSIGMYWHVFGM